MKDEYTYDPLYRIITDYEGLHSLQGKYAKAFARIKGIANLGVIPKVFEMADYSKYEHTIGLIHQICSLLEIIDQEVIPDTYRDALRVSATFLHIGHLPYTFTTERALLYASNLGGEGDENRVRKFLEAKIDNVLEKAKIDGDRAEELKKSLFGLYSYKKLYRFLSADFVIREWERITDRIEGVGENHQSIVVRNLIDDKSDGNQYLELANKADYVQRDALYLGTAKIDISPHHLYGSSEKYSPRFSVDEEKLLEANHEYLDWQFYSNKKVIQNTRLLEKIICALLVSSKFDLSTLQAYDDRKFEDLLVSGQNINGEATSLTPRWQERSEDILNPFPSIAFKFIFSINQHLPSENPIDAEYYLLNKSKSLRGLLEYPFRDGLLLSIETEERQLQHYEIDLFVREKDCQLISVLSIVQQLSKYLGFLNTVKIRKGLSSLLSKTGRVRFESDSFGANKQVLRAIALGIDSVQERDDAFIDDLIGQLSSIRTYSSIWDGLHNYIWLQSRGHRVLAPSLGDEDRSKSIAGGLLNLPIKLLQYKSVSTYMEELINELKTLAESGTTSCKVGDFFEAICLLELILDKRGKFKFYINGLIMTEYDKHKVVDEGEHDIIELIINDDGFAECNIYACSVSDDCKSDNRAKLHELGVYIHENVFVNAEINTYFATPDHGTYTSSSPNFEKAGTSYSAAS